MFTIQVDDNADSAPETILSLMVGMFVRIDEGAPRKTAVAEGEIMAVGYESEGPTVRDGVSTTPLRGRTWVALCPDVDGDIDYSSAETLHTTIYTIVTYL